VDSDCRCRHLANSHPCGELAGVPLAIETGEEPLSRIMAGLQSSYTQSFNRRHRRVGHLFQGRYKAYIVDKDAWPP